MVKPQLYKECGYAFDCQFDREFKYLWDESNNQSVANELIIRNNITNEIVYRQKQETLLLKHTVSANSLVNGETYNVYIKVYDKDGNVSENSDVVIFKCFTTPTLSLNINQNQVVRNSSYSFKINYNQLEGEELQSYILELYDSNKNFIYSKKVNYNIDSPIQISNLIDNTSYYIKGICHTINHMQNETDMILFYVEYNKPSQYSYITVENRYNYGDIQFTSFLVSIEGHGINGEAVFSDGYVDTINGASIKFDNNFDINNGMIILKGKGFDVNKPILLLKNKNNRIITFSWKYGYYEENDDKERCYVEAICSDGVVESIHMSNFIEYNNDKFYNINIRIVNHYMDIEIKDGG